MMSTIPSSKTYTVCFSGTACTRDEGEVTRPDSDKRIYCGETGYIPVRLHKEISDSLTSKAPSAIVRGVGENDWALPRNDSAPLVFDGPLKASADLLEYVRSYSGGDQHAKATQGIGWSAAALALHAANLAAGSGAQQYNFIGHSRGAVECIMAAWFLYAYGRKEIPINLFAIDPVPGPGEWYGILTQLPPNVVHYVGVYAWDEFDRTLMALVPRPNGAMMGKSDDVSPGRSWKTLADEHQLTDPLLPGTSPQPNGFELYACRGRHGTLAGNVTNDGNYIPTNVDARVSPVPKLVYKMARSYLSRWGTAFATSDAVADGTASLQQKIHADHALFDAMRNAGTRTSLGPLGFGARRVSSISGSNPLNRYYLEQVAGVPPLGSGYPGANNGASAGWVKWMFL